jgi:hemolysin III
LAEYPGSPLRSTLVADAPPAATEVVGGDGLVGSPSKPRLRGVSHQVAAFVFPALGLVPLVLAPSAGAKAAVAVYVVGVTAMYVTSACYHRGHWTLAAKNRMRRLDHSMILVGISSTYTPVAVMGLSPTTAAVLLGTVWGLAAVGVVVRNLSLDAPRWMIAAVYLGVGWAAVAVLPALWRNLGVATSVLLIVGGLVYSLGALIFSRRRPDPVPDVFGYHEVFHALVLLAGLVFYVAVLTIVLRA